MRGEAFDNADMIDRLRANTIRLHEYSMELHEDFRRARRRDPWLAFAGAVLFLASVYATAKWFLPLITVCA